MGSLLEITVPGPGAGRHRQAVTAAFQEAERLEGLLSRYRPGSLVSCLNRLAAQQAVRVDPEFAAFLDRCLELAEATQGAVDFTVLPLLRLWGIGGTGGTRQRLSPQAVREALQSIGYHRVALDRRRWSVRYLHPGTQIEFGAFGKGHAVDRAAAVLKDHGVPAALISFGSTLYAMGRPPGCNGWRIAIRDPRNRQRAVDVVSLHNAALSTSGDYEQGRHILDPRTGQPVREIASATVTAPTALEADAISTAACVLGPEDGIRAIEARHGVEGLLLSRQGSGRLGCTRTSGWKTGITSSRYRRHPTRREFLASLAAWAAWTMLPAPLASGMVLLSREAALKRLMPRASDFSKQTVTLTTEQYARVQELLGYQFRERRYTFWVGKRDGAIEGYAVLLDVIGKEQPITFLVGIDPGGTVLGVEVLVYRESQGSEIRSPAFMKQFLGKTLEAPLRLGQDVDAISGATLSARSTAYAVKKALALVAVVYGEKPHGAP